MNLRRRMAAANQPARHAIRAVLGAHEDQEAARLRSQQVFEQFLLLVRLDLKGSQLDVFGRLEHRANLDAHRVVQVLARHFLDRTFERGRVAQGLPHGGKRGRDARNGRLEAHIEHPVYLVQHQNLHLVEADELTLEIILKASGRGDDEARATANGVEL